MPSAHPDWRTQGVRVVHADDVRRRLLLFDGHRNVPYARLERIAAPPTRSPITGEQEVRHFPTGVNQTVRSAGPPMILIIAAAASIGAAITVTLYKVWRRNQAPIAVQQPVEQRPGREQAHRRRQRQALHTAARTDKGSARSGRTGA